MLEKALLFLYFSVGQTPSFAFLDWGSDFQLVKNWSEVLGASVREWLRIRLSLKVRIDYALHVNLSLILYRLSVLPLCQNRWKSIVRLLFSLLWGGCKLKFRRAVCVQLPYYRGIGMPHLVSHQNTSRLVCLRHALIVDSLQARSFTDAFPDLAITPVRFVD